MHVETHTSRSRNSCEKERNTWEKKFEVEYIVAINVYSVAMTWAKGRKQRKEGNRGGKKGREGNEDGGGQTTDDRRQWQTYSVVNEQSFEPNMRCPARMLGAHIQTVKVRRTCVHIASRSTPDETNRDKLSNWHRPSGTLPFASRRTREFLIHVILCRHRFVRTIDHQCHGGVCQGLFARPRNPFLFSLLSTSDIFPLNAMWFRLIAHSVIIQSSSTKIFHQIASLISRFTLCFLFARPFSHIFFVHKSKKRCSWSTSITRSCDQTFYTFPRWTCCVYVYYTHTQSGHLNE